jgi:hypothetical protein
MALASHQEVFAALVQQALAAVYIAAVVVLLLPDSFLHSSALMVLVGILGEA